MLVRLRLIWQVMDCIWINFNLNSQDNLNKNTENNFRDILID